MKTKETYELLSAAGSVIRYTESIKEARRAVDADEANCFRVAAEPAPKKKPAHTPGPWRMGQQGKPPVGKEWETWGVWARGGCNVALCDSSVAANEANARLIAAAPDLLAALKDLCAASNPYRPSHRAVAEVDAPTLEEAVKRAFVIIAKSSDAA